MSLLKNGDGVKVSTFEEVPENTSYKIKEYIDLNGMSIPIFNVDSDYKTELKLKDIIVIQANLDDYDGYLFGNWTGGNISNEMCIFKSGNYVSWFLGQGGTTQNQIIYARVNYQSGIHLYGFSSGKAIYDNLILSSEQTIDENLNIASNKQHPSYFSIGGTASGNCKIYRIIINCSSTNKTYSYYPCSNGTNKYMYEALATGRFVYDAEYTSSGTNTPLNFNSATVGNNVKYGISLDDVKSIIGSKYRDLMAMMAEDSGNTYTIGGVEPDSTYKITDGQILHEFAFALKDISIPESATVLSGQSSSYKKGELIYGHRPKWNIWANCMPYSIWNRPETDYNGSYDTSKKVYAMYNLTEHWGKDGKVRLEWFRDYCEGDSDRPKVSFINPDGTDASAINIHYHNGVPCVCTENDIMPSFCDGYGYGFSNMLKYSLDGGNSIFRYNNTLPDSSVTMKLGNLINWNTSQKALFNADTYRDTTGNTPLDIPTMNQLIYGMVATLTHQFLTAVSLNSGGYTTKLVDVMIGYATEQTRQTLDTINASNRLYDYPFVALSSDSNEITKKKFKEGLISVTENGVTTYEKLNFDLLRATGNEEVRLYNEITAAVNKQGKHIYTIDAVGSMNLLKRPTEILATETPREEDLVYLNKFIEPTKLSITGQFDKKNELNRQSVLDTFYDANLIEFDYKPLLPSAPQQNDSYGSDSNLRLILMNQNDYAGKDPYLYTSETNIYLFPLGYKGYGDNYAYRHYTITNNRTYNDNLYYGGLIIPFLLTTVDVSSYSKMIENGVNRTSLRGMDINYYLIIRNPDWERYVDSSTENGINVSGIIADDAHKLYLCNNDPISNGQYYHNNSSSYILWSDDTTNYTKYSNTVYKKGPGSWGNTQTNSYSGTVSRLKRKKTDTYPYSVETYHYAIRNYQFKYATDIKLRVIAEIINSEDVLDENNNVIDKIITKDRVNKPLYLVDSEFNPIFNLNFRYDLYLGDTGMTGLYDASNYLNLNVSPEYAWFINIGTEDIPHVKKVDENNNEYFPKNTTVKFWVMTEDKTPNILRFKEWWDYSSVNDSWYKRILGLSLYIFVKDLLNNDWMGTSDFRVTVSHWLYGKKINAFYISNSSTAPVKLLSTTGSYNDGVSVNQTGNIILDNILTNWKDFIDLSGSGEKHVWMSERFFAKLSNLDEYDYMNRPEYYNIYVNVIEKYLFTDQEWTNPIEIKEDTFKPIKFFVFVNSAYTSGENSIISSPEVFQQYLKYSEGGGFYGVKKDGIVYTAISKVEYDTSDREYKMTYPIYYDDNTLHETESFNGFTQYLIAVDENYNVLSIDADSDYSQYQSKIILNGIHENNNYLMEYVLYYAETKYMFSKTSTNSPSKEPRAWITFDEFLNSGVHSSEYKYMYTNKIIFDKYGLCYNEFNIIQITEEGEQDNFYPIVNSQIYKLNGLTGYVDYWDKNWYKLSYSESDKTINEYDSKYYHSEVLAPYKIDGLNIDVSDVVQANFNIDILAYNKNVDFEVMTCEGDYDPNDNSNDPDTILKVYAKSYLNEYTGQSAQYWNRTNLLNYLKGE